MFKQPQYTDSKVRRLLRQDPERAIEWAFTNYFTDLCRSVYRIVPDTKTAEDIVQDVFVDVWKKRNTLTISTSLGAYLRRAARNKALNYLRDRKIISEDYENIPDLEASANTNALRRLEVADLEKRIEEAIDNLPERCRLIFVLSRFEKMTYQEIADELNISIKTVENQIVKALKILREKLL